MALFPRIQSPCPYKGDLSAIMDGDVCRLCKREVFDLTPMSDGERVAVMKGCSGEVCVSYRMPALAAMALAVTAVALPTAAAACADETETLVVVGGGIHDPQNVQYVQVPDRKPAPALPVVYEPANSKISSKAPS
jgi:predicted Fe-S protein YdhL (DUF1289 family)